MGKGDMNQNSEELIQMGRTSFNKICQIFLNYV